MTKRNVKISITIKVSEQQEKYEREHIQYVIGLTYVGKYIVASTNVFLPILKKNNSSTHGSNGNQHKRTIW